MSEAPTTAPAPIAVAVADTPDKGTRERVVQKGETLNKIMFSEYPEVYNSSYSRLKDLFLKANKRLKDEDMVIAGKPLLVPALPARMFEAVGGSVGSKPALNVAAKKSPPAMIRIDHLINSDAPKRKAPSDAVKVVDKGRDKEGDKSKEKDRTDRATADARRPRASSNRDTREYEVQSKDTFSSIAKEQCGSTTFWQQIKRLNPDVDPNKLKPGTKLKLPAKRLQSNAMAGGESRRR
jgi:LysM repeat protein